MDRKASPTFQGMKGLMNFMRCRHLRLALGEDLDVEEGVLVAAGLMRLPVKEKSSDFSALAARRWRWPIFRQCSEPNAMRT